MRRKFIIRKIKSEFECQRCGICCRAPGFVFLTGGDIRAMATQLRMTEEKFFEKYGEWAQGSRVLKRNDDESCIFLKEQGCEIHAVKPKQCRQFPIKWREPDAYEYCEGIKKLSKPSA